MWSFIDSVINDAINDINYYKNELDITMLAEGLQYAAYLNKIEKLENIRTKLKVLYLITDLKDDMDTTTKDFIVWD